MKYLVCLTIYFCFILCSAAQTQVGYVRTLERPNQASVGIEGATVSILEYPNALVTKKNGKFSFAIPGKKQGSSYTVSRIEKKGYTLVDKQLRGRRYAYSADVPLEIVMVSNQQLEKDKLRIEKKAIEKARRNYERRISTLEKQLQEKIITEQEQSEQLERLAKEYENYIGLIDKMAERYALTDYKGLNDINRMINECIENAELERADSLINSKGDFDVREQEIRSQMELNKKAAETLAKSQKDAEFKLNDLAQDYFNKYTIFAANYQVDSAAYYLERRANLDDTTNIDWLYDAASYLKDIGNVDKALSLFKRAHDQYVTLGLNDNRHALILEIIADLYYHYRHSRSNIETIIDFYELAIDAFEEINPLHPHLVHCYDYLGLTISTKPSFTGESINDALRGTKIGNKADNEGDTIPLLYGSRVIMNSIIDNPIIDVDNIYYGQTIRFEDDDPKRIVDYYERALNTVDSIYGPNSDQYAKNQKVLGDVLNGQFELDKAFKCYQSASIIFNNIDSLHPELGDVYNKMAGYYYRSDKNDTINAIDYYFRAIRVYQSLYGKYCPDLISIYHRLFNLYRMMDYQKALEIHVKYDELMKHIYGNRLESGYAAISGIYRDMGDYDKALEYLEDYKKYLDLQHESKSSLNVSSYGNYYSILGDIKYLQKEYPIALSSYQQKIEFVEAVWVDFGKIGCVFLCQGDTVNALKNFNQSLEILRNGKWSPVWMAKIETYCGNFKQYFNQCDYPRALSCFNDLLSFLSQYKHYKEDFDLLFHARDADKILQLIKQVKN